MVVDAREPSGRFSLVRVRELCVDGDAPPPPPPGGLPLPACSKRWSGPGGARRRALMRSDGSFKGLAAQARGSDFLAAEADAAAARVTERLLHVEVLPSERQNTTAGVQGTKFKIMGVTAC